MTQPGSGHAGTSIRALAFILRGLGEIIGSETGWAPESRCPSKLEGIAILQTTGVPELSRTCGAGSKQYSLDATASPGNKQFIGFSALERNFLGRVSSHLARHSKDSGGKEDLLLMVGRVAACGPC